MLYLFKFEGIPAGRLHSLPPADVRRGHVLLRDIHVRVGLRKVHYFP